MFHKFLIALDASERAEGVFRCGVDLAGSMGASIHLFRAVAVPPEFPPAGHMSELDALPAYLLKQAEAHLQAFAEQMPRLHIQTMVVESTQPWRAIIDVADEIGADLIVVGSHGYHGLDYLLGTNAGKVANLARRNVLVVRSQPDPPLIDTYRGPARAAGAGRP